MKQRSQIQKWIRTEEKKEPESRVEKVEKLAAVFGETKKSKVEREKEQRAAVKKKKEKLERGKVVMQKRSLFERGGRGRRGKLECLKKH